MKKISFILANFLIFSIPTINPVNFRVPEVPNINEALSSGRKIVVFKQDVTETDRQKILEKFSAKNLKRFDLALKANVLEGISPKEEAGLLSNPLIERVDTDVRVEALAQVLPWGVDRIDADKVWTATPTPDTGLGIRVGVIDTGIDFTHPDLAANVRGGYNAINSSRSFLDDNGHGSHVSGIIAAINNSIGVVGVAPNVFLYGIKVLDKRGSGWLSDIIEGLDWSIANKMQVVNMSLGTTSNIQSLHDAVARAKDAGIVVVAAAGNNGGAVIYPAAYPEAIAVSAMDSSGNIASWSSRGPEVDLAAPGVSIFSTYKNQTYATLSGTSMASPHVAGSAALVLKKGNCVVLLQAGCTPNDVQSLLEATAEQVPQDTMPGKDPLYGSGLVDAEKAVQ